MTVTAFPNGVSSFGVPVWPNPNDSFATVMFVGSSTAGYSSAAGGANYDKPAPSLLSVAKEGLVDTADRGTLIMLRKGHTENVDAADWLSLLGTRKRITIRGLGEGPERGTLTWTLATSTLLLDTANVVLENLNLNFDPGAGTVNVAAPITATGAGSGIKGCTIRMGTDANSKVTVGLTVNAADFVFGDNLVYGETAAEATTLIDINAAHRLWMYDNYIAGATSAAAVGVVRFVTGASLNVVLERNSYINRKAASTNAVIGLAAVSGVSRDEHFAYLNTTSLTPWLTSTGIMTFHRPTVTNTAGETGTEIVGTVSA